MFNASTKIRLCALPLALLVAQAHAGPEYYCDETVNNNPPVPCWLVGPYQGKCPTLAATTTWTCLASDGWVHGGGPSPRDNTHMQSGAAPWGMPAATTIAALTSEGQGRNALLTLAGGALAAEHDVAVLRLVHADADAGSTELALRHDPKVGAVLSVVRRGDPAAATTELAVIPLSRELDHVQAAWYTDPVDGAVLTLATRNARLKLPLPELGYATLIEAHPSAVAMIQFDLDGARHHDVFGDR